MATSTQAPIIDITDLTPLVPVHYELLRALLDVAPILTITLSHSIYENFTPILYRRLSVTLPIFYGLSIASPYYRRTIAAFAHTRVLRFPDLTSFHHLWAVTYYRHRKFDRIFPNVRKIELGHAASRLAGEDEEADVVWESIKLRRIVEGQCGGTLDELTFTLNVKIGGVTLPEEPAGEPKAGEEPDWRALAYRGDARGMSATTMLTGYTGDDATGYVTAKKYLTEVRPQVATYVATIPSPITDAFACDMPAVLWENGELVRVIVDAKRPIRTGAPHSLPNTLFDYSISHMILSHIVRLRLQRMAILIRLEAEAEEEARLAEIEALEQEGDDMVEKMPIPVVLDVPQRIEYHLEGAWAVEQLVRGDVPTHCGRNATGVQEFISQCCVFIELDRRILG
ncbi:hypothetical protein IAT38_001963 [Cryptococcus sp. DSM 104549]